MELTRRAVASLVDPEEKLRSEHPIMWWVQLVAFLGMGISFGFRAFFYDEWRMYFYAAGSAICLPGFIQFATAEVLRRRRSTAELTGSRS
jgi:hypothetical protein